jgi:hypothetical protein
MWLYPGPSCLNRSFPKELSTAWIHKVLDHGANLNPGAGPTPLREGVASTRVSLFGSILAAYAFLSFHRAHGLVQGLRGTHSTSQGVNLPKDVARWEVNHAHNEKMWARKERKQAQSPPEQ